MREKPQMAPLPLSEVEVMWFLDKTKLKLFLVFFSHVYLCLKSQNVCFSFFFLQI